MFNKGKIQITIPVTHFTPGDIISGTVTLELKKSVKAKELAVFLIGELSTTQQRRTMSSSSTSTERRKIYDFKQQIDGEKEYTQGQDFKFEIKIPSDILNARPQMPELGGVLGQGIKVAQAAAAMAGVIPLQQVKWYLLAKLDIPGGLDIRKKVDITIG